MKIPFFGDRKRLPTIPRGKVLVSEDVLTAIQHFYTLMKRDFDYVRGTVDGEYNGNPYPSYESQVQEASRKYDGESSWGCDIARNIVDVRAALTVGAGPQLKVHDTIKNEDSAAREIAFCKEFMKVNGLNGKTGWEWAREAEIEGKFLVKLSFDSATKQVLARFIPWITRHYTVYTREDDYTEFTRVEYTDPNGAAKILNKGEFVYGKFGGRTAYVNTTPTKIGAVLGAIETVAKALRDIREINHLFASPTPTVECEDANAAEELYTRLTSINWKIGKLLVIGGGKYKMVGPPVESFQTMETEITLGIKRISGSTGIPVHFIGFPDLMSNRSTSDSTNEMLFASMAGEKQTWEDIYTQIFSCAMEISNKENGTAFNTSSIVAEIPESSQMKMRQIIDFWVELRDRKAVSLKTLIEKIPGVDPDQEMERLSEELKEEIAQLADSLVPQKRDTDPGEKRTMEKRLGRPGE